MKPLFFSLLVFLTASSTAQEITVGQPRIWRYERVYSLVDGLLRDVEAVQLTNISKLDPNALNATSVEMLQTMLRAGVSYDQALGVGNTISRQNLISATQNASLYDAQYATLLKQQISLTDNLTTAQVARAKAQQDMNLAVATNTGVDAAKQTYNDADTAVSDLNKQIADSKTSLAALGARPDVKVNDKVNALTSGDASTLLDSSKVGSNGQLGSMWSNMPNEMKTLITKQMGTAPTLPATKQFDNHITLLYERMARELAALNDDTTQGMQVYLLGFDVGIYAGKRQKNQVARVEYDLSSSNECHDAHAYQLYPGVSAYNLSEYSAQTHANFFSGALRFLNGIGANIDYQRLKEQMHSGLTQSVYVSGFGAGRHSFGWYFGPAPFEATVSPGERTVYAFVVAPKACKKPIITYKARWQSRDGSLPSVEDIGALTPPWPKGDPDMSIRRFEYDPIAVSSERAPKTTTVQIVLRDDIDPNLIVTVGSTVLKRVRDWRGRATKPQADEFFVLNNGALTSDTSGQAFDLSRGILEADQLDADTWIASNSNTLLLNISTPVAGIPFPAIRLQSGGAVVDVIDELEEADQIRMGDVYLFPSCKDQGPIQRSAFLPLRSNMPTVPNARLQAHVSAKSNNELSEIHLSATDGTSADTPTWLDRNAQVVLIDSTRTANKPYAWPLLCSNSGGELSCAIDSKLLQSGDSPLPQLLQVQVTIPGRLKAITDFDPREEPKFAFSRLTRRETRSSKDGSFTGWQILATAVNVRPNITSLNFVMPDNTWVNSDDRAADDKTFRFDIKVAKFSSLTDEAYLYGWIDKPDVNDPSCNHTKNGQAYCELSNITGLRSLLLPTITGWDESNGQLYGEGFGPITAVVLDGNLQRKLDAHIGQGTIMLPQSHDAKLGTGLLYFWFAGVPVPAMYDGRHIVWRSAVSGSQVATLPKIVAKEAEQQPKVALPGMSMEGTTKQSTPQSQGKIDSEAPNQKKLNSLPY